MGSGESKNLTPTSIEIYFWNGGNKNVGHVSLFLPDNYLYISFWPEGDVNLKNSARGVSSMSNTYQEDIEAEGRRPDRTLHASLDLDVPEMEKRWATQKKEKYNFWTNNCSDAVFHVLEAGNDDFFNNTNPFPPSQDPSPNWSKNDWLTYVRYELANFRLHGLQAKIQ